MLWFGFNLLRCPHCNSTSLTESGINGNISQYILENNKDNSTEDSNTTVKCINCNSEFKKSLAVSPVTENSLS